MAERPRDPRKTTGLIGRTCKGSNALSEPVLTVDDLVVPTGFRRNTACSCGAKRRISMRRQSHPASHAKPVSVRSIILASLRSQIEVADVDCDIHFMTSIPRAAHGNALLDLSVTISPGRHLIPSRTQKLSLGCR